MGQTAADLLSSFLHAYAESIDILLDAVGMVDPEIAPQVLQRAGEEIRYLQQLLNPDLLHAEQYADLSECCWRLMHKLDAQVRRG